MTDFISNIYEPYFIDTDSLTLCCLDSCFPISFQQMPDYFTLLNAGQFYSEKCRTIILWKYPNISLIKGTSSGHNHLSFVLICARTYYNLFQQFHFGRNNAA